MASQTYPRFSNHISRLRIAATEGNPSWVAIEELLGSYSYRCRAALTSMPGAFMSQFVTCLHSKSEHVVGEIGFGMLPTKWQ